MLYSYGCASAVVLSDQFALLSYGRICVAGYTDTFLAEVDALLNQHHTHGEGHYQTEVLAGNV